MSNDHEFDGLSSEQISDVLTLRARVESDNSAMRRQPVGVPNIEKDGDFLFYSWNEETTSLGVENWLVAQSVILACYADLEVLRARGYPKDSRAFIGLGREVDRHSWVSVLGSIGGLVSMSRAERVCGESDDLFYPGWDWVPGVIFVAKAKPPQAP